MTNKFIVNGYRIRTESKINGDNTAMNGISLLNGGTTKYIYHRHHLNENDS